jgi:hypothetical protein
MKSSVKFILGLAVFAGLLGVILYSLYLSLIRFEGNNLPRGKAVEVSELKSSYRYTKRHTDHGLISSMDFQRKEVE